MLIRVKKVITNPVFIVAGLMLCTGAVEAASFGGNTGSCLNPSMTSCMKQRQAT